MTNNEIQYRKILPEQSIANFVECFWQLENSTGIEKEVVVMPDGNIDLLILKDRGEPFQIWLMDLILIITKIKLNLIQKCFL